MRGKRCEWSLVPNPSSLRTTAFLDVVWPHIHLTSFQFGLFLRMVLANDTGPELEGS